MNTRLLNCAALLGTCVIGICGANDALGAVSAAGLSLLTSGVISDDGSGNYTYPFTIRRVATGGIPGAVHISITETRYFEGQYVRIAPGGPPLEDSQVSIWAPKYVARCPYLVANPQANVAAARISVLPASVILDSSGVGHFEVSYAKQYASWVQVRITATAASPEDVGAAEFVLPISTADVGAPGAPSGSASSPFGDTETAGCTSE